ncbi:MAG: ADP-ribosylation factor-like protein [Candidatus Odinarchaeota archaeon]
MDGWMSGDEVVSRFGYKILIAGLSQAGKTAVKRIFFMKQRTEDVDELAATIEYERMAVSITGVPITIIDLGGQRVFIRRFLNSFSPFIFSSVYTFIFVIDVAAKSTKNSAIQYFKSCVERLKSYSPDAEYFVFLHKNDLVRGLPNYESIHAQLKEQFQLECSEKIHFLRTTIYQPNTVMDAFGRIFELTLPDIAKSEYVGGKIIGGIEEYAEKFAAVELQDACCPKCGTTFIDMGKGLLCNFCGYKRKLGQLPVPPETTSSSLAHSSTESKVSSPVTLDKLQRQLQELMGKNTTGEDIIANTAPLRSENAVNGSDGRDSAVLEKLKSMMQESLDKEDLESELSPKIPADENVAPESATRSLLYLHDAAFEEETKDFLLSAVNKIPGEIEGSDRSYSMDVSFLTNFYGIKNDEAIKLTENGYNRMFEAAARAGVPVSLLLDVYLKYIPYLKNRDLMISNSENKINKLFLAYLQGMVKEEEIFDCLIMIARSPALSIKEIIKTQLISAREEKQRKKIALAREKAISAKDALVSKSQDDEIDKSIIPLSTSEKIGFKAEIAGSNCNLIFYQGSHRLGSNLIHRYISVRDLKYLLAFEAVIPIVENYDDFVETAAPIIYETIEKIFESEKKDQFPDKKE